MGKISAILGTIGLALVLVSVLPWPSTVGGARESATSTALATAAHGRALFVAKGCITCHLNGRIEGSQTIAPSGPDLTTYTNDPAFLRRWLADPALVKPGTAMPDLNLSATEIESLVAFLNEPRSE